MKRYERFDDIDSIADAMRQKAQSIPRTVEGMLELVEHPAGFEIPAMDALVVAPGHFTDVARRGDEKLSEVADALLPRLRQLLDEDVEPGVKQRALYALVRIAGAECPEALAGLESRDFDHERAVLCALTDADAQGARPSTTLPASFAEPIARLCAHGQSDEAPASGSFFFDRPLVWAALRLPDPGPALMVILEKANLRNELARALTQSAGMDVSSAMGGLLTRFEECVSAVEQARERGLPDRNALTTAAIIARMVGRDASVARRAVSILDVVPGTQRVGPKPLRSPDETHMPPLLEAFSVSIEASIDDLDLPSRRTLAGYLLGDYVPFYAIAALAWARLPATDAEALSARFAMDEPRLGPVRWDAVAQAFVALEHRPPALGAIFTGYADTHNLSPALREALERAPVDVEKIRDHDPKGAHQRGAPARHRAGGAAWRHGRLAPDPAQAPRGTVSRHARGRGAAAEARRRRERGLLRRRD